MCIRDRTDLTAAELAITNLQAKVQYEVQKIFSLASNQASISQSIDFRPGQVYIENNFDLSAQDIVSRTSFVARGGGNQNLLEVSNSSVQIRNGSNQLVASTNTFTQYFVVEDRVATNVVQNRNGNIIRFQIGQGRTVLQCNESSVESAFPFSAAELQGGSVRIFGQSTGSIQHPSALQMAVSSSATPSASEILLSMEPTSGVTVNTSLTVFQHLQVSGQTVLNGGLTVGGVAVPKTVTGSFVANTGISNNNHTVNANSGQTWYMTEHPVTFPIGAFSAAPAVFVNQTAGNASGHVTIMRIWAIDVTTSGCTVVVADYAGSGVVGISWMAVGS